MAQEVKQHEEKQVTFNHLSIHNNLKADKDFVQQHVDRSIKVRITSKCKFLIFLVVMVTLAIIFLGIGLMVTFSFKERKTKEFSVNGERVIIQEVKLKKWNRFQTSTEGVIYKTTVDSEEKIDVYDEDTGATVRIEGNQIETVVLEVGYLMENALTSENKFQEKEKRLLKEQDEQEEQDEQKVITYNEVKEKIQKKLKDITKKKSGKQVTGSEETIQTEVYDQETSNLIEEEEQEDENDTDQTSDSIDNSNDQKQSSSKSKKRENKSKKLKKSKKIQKKRSMNTMAEVDQFVNSIANDYSDKIDHAMQAAQEEAAPNSSKQKKNSKSSVIMTDCVTVKMDPPTFLCRKQSKPNPSKTLQTDDSPQSKQFVLKVTPN